MNIVFYISELFDENNVLASFCLANTGTSTGHIQLVWVIAGFDYYSWVWLLTYVHHIVTVTQKFQSLETFCPIIDTQLSRNF